MLLDKVVDETTGLDQAIDHAQREIALLREYRTRLIADVVTGKVDMRAAAQGLPDEVEEMEPLDEVEAMGDTGEENTDDLDAARGGRGMNPRFTITNAIAQGLARIKRARGFLEAAQLSEGWVRQMSERALLLEAHHTTHIEGTHLTLAEAEQLLAGQPVPQADADDVRELLNYRDAFNLVSDYLNSGAPITEGLVREIHKRLVRGVRGDRAQPGQYRLVQNYVANSITGAIIYTPPPPGDVPALMRDLVEWLNNPAKCTPCWSAASRSSTSSTFIPSWTAMVTVSAALYALSLSRRLRFQAPIYHQRVL